MTIPGKIAVKTLPPEFISFNVERNKYTRKYHVKMKIKISDKTNSIYAIKLFKSKLTKPLLSKDYEISQLAAEKISSGKHFSNMSTVLYDKKIFSKNSKVSIFGEAAAATKKESPIESIDFAKIALIKTVKNVDVYEFTDHGVIFGETYTYSAVCLDKKFVHSSVSIKQTVNIEDIQHPEPPQNVSADVVPSGILLTIKTSKDNDIYAFDIYRKKISDFSYEFIGRVVSTQTQSFFSDKGLIPGFTYEYKVFSVDFFNNVSFSATKCFKEFNTLFERKSSLPTPMIKFGMNNGYVEIEGFKNGSDVLAHTIERQDVWRKEKGFSIKTRKSISWPGKIIFKKNVSYKFVDSSVKTGKVYKYRITLFSKNNQNTTYLTTPPIKILKDMAPVTVFSNVNEVPKNNCKINYFSLIPINGKFEPQIVKATWSINGEYDHIVILSLGKEIFRIDNIHEFAYVNVFKKGVEYNLSIETRDDDENVLGAIGNIYIKI